VSKPPRYPGPAVGDVHRPPHVEHDDVCIRQAKAGSPALLIQPDPVALRRMQDTLPQQIETRSAVHASF